MPFDLSMSFLFPLILLAVFLSRGIWIIMEYERGVVFRLGRYRMTKLAGLRWVIPFIDRVIKVSLGPSRWTSPPRT